MAETEFAARGVRIERWLRSLTRAGQVLIKDGRLELLTSYGTEIDSAPVENVHASRAWFGRGDRARASVNGTRYLLTLDPEGHAQDDPGGTTAGMFLEAVRTARTRTGPPARFG